MLILDRLRQRLAVAIDQTVAKFSASSSPPSAATDAARSAADLPRADDYVGMLRPTADARFGDYQANCAMPLAKVLRRPPREVAAEIVRYLQVDEFCLPAEIAGPGFINLRLHDQFLADSLRRALVDPRLGVPETAEPLTILVDYSSPNVAKPMHVGHIRSTVIGDALARVLRFLGHRVITDNHLGDWGTQFGMVIYGFKHFGDEVAFAENPVAELSRLYRLVNDLIGFHQAKQQLPQATAAVQAAAAQLAEAQQALAAGGDARAVKQQERAVLAARRRWEAATEQLESLQRQLDREQREADFLAMAEGHAEIGQAVLSETAKLHDGDVENLAMWKRFLPHCRDEIDRVYQRLNVSFDHTLGESFYHEMLGDVVERLLQAGLASDSEGAVCVFLPEFDSPMIVQKKDGAYLYATTDLATLFYRRQRFDVDEVLYVVDTRQSEHFEKLFAVARHLGFEQTRLVHVNFGTVLGEDGKPFKTRSGTSVGLDSLLDEAVVRAQGVVCAEDRTARFDPPLSEQEQQRIATVVGYGAIKYADLAHHRTSDYKFDIQKMVALEGNTAAYVQYAYARGQAILQKGNYQPPQELAAVPPLLLTSEAERTLALTLLRFGESLAQVRVDYAPSFLVDYLHELARAYNSFNDSCPVLKAADAATGQSRLALVAASAAILQRGLELLGIEVVKRM